MHEKEKAFVVFMRKLSEQGKATGGKLDICTATSGLGLEEEGEDAKVVVTVAVAVVVRRRVRKEGGKVR